MRRWVLLISSKEAMLLTDCLLEQEGVENVQYATNHKRKGGGGGGGSAHAIGSARSASMMAP